MASISNEELDRLFQLVSHNPAQALQEVEQAEVTFHDDLRFRLSSAGLFIDIGAGLGRRDCVERGIHILEQFYATPRGPKEFTLLYNLANGYFALHDLTRQEPGFAFDPDQTPLLAAKRYYREALALSEQAEARLQSMLRVNYANCLAQFGRSVEAIELYDVAVGDMPENAMAWGNLGMELNRYAYIARDPSLIEAARDALTSALEGKRLEDTGLPNARPRFEKILHEVEMRLQAMQSGHPHTHTHTHERASNITGKHAQVYVQFCLDQQLFLNFSLRNRRSADSQEDSVSLSIATALEDDTTYYRLSRIVNEVKERFAVARLLLYEACAPVIKTREYDILTVYTDNLDYAVYGISVGKLKVAFEAAYNVLDKIAFFVNDYYDLGIAERNVSFTTVWKRPNEPVRPELSRLKNWHVWALYDISRDLGAGGYLNTLAMRRNYSTHRYLVPHIELMGWRVEADSAGYHMPYAELFQRTIDLMQLVRNAIIYWIASVDQEERKKRMASGGPTMPMFLPRAQHYPFGPQGV